MMLRKFVLFTAAILAAACTQAQEPAETELKDYGQGFAVLHKLGLPSIPKDAQYIACQRATISRVNLGQGGPYNRGGNGFAMKGDSWLIKTDADDRADLVLGHTKPIALYNGTKRWEKAMAELDAKKLDKEAHEAAQVLLRTEPWVFRSTNWEEVNLNKEVESLLKFIRKPPPKKDTADSDNEFMLNYYAAERQKQMIPLLFFAAHLYDREMQAEANEIAAWIFKETGDTKQTLGAALNTLGDDHYTRVLDEFSYHNDLERFASELDAHLKKFPRGWDNAPAAALLAKRLRKQLSEPAFEYKNPAGVPFTEAQKKLIPYVWKMERRAFTFSLPEIWLTGSITEEELAENEENEMTLLATLHMEALPPLLAMLDNDRFSDHPSREIMLGYYSASLSSGIFMNGEEKQPDLEEQYEALAKPDTIAQIARTYLEQVLFLEDSPDTDLSELELEELQEVGLDFYRKYKGKSPEEMRIIYIQSSDEQKDTLLRDALVSTNSTLSQMARETILGAEDPADYDSLVAEYATSEGTNAAAFVEAYVDLLEKIPVDDYYRWDSEEEKKTHLDGYRQLVRPVDMDALFEELLAVENFREAPELGMKIRGAFSRMPMAELMPRLLDTCLRATTDKKRRDLSGLLQWPVYRKNNDDAEETEFPPIESCATQWRKLLEYDKAQDHPTFKAAYYLISLYDSSDSTELAPYRAMGIRLSDFYHQRATELLDGKTGEDLTPIPDPASVDDASLATLVEQIKQQTTAETLKQLDTLDLAQWARLYETKEQDDEALNRKLLPAAWRIHSMRIKDYAEPFPVFKSGDMLSIDTIKAVRQLCVDRLNAGKNTMVSMQVNQGLYGTYASVNGSDDYHMEDGMERHHAFVNGDDELKRGILVANFDSREMEDARFTRAIDLPNTNPRAQAAKPKPADDDFTASLEEDDERGRYDEAYAETQEKAFWKTLETYFAAKDDPNPWIYLRITFWGIQPADEPSN
jgi:hypothetical protein